MADRLQTGSRLIRVAVVGNPNTGKTTLFNMLTGMRARVGNYPGVTVEKKIGRTKYGGYTLELIDLPGNYSLSPRSPDEMVSVDVLLSMQPDVGEVDAVICVADATNLERNLYLVSQLLELGIPTVVALNMWDVAQSLGVRIDVDELSRRLGGTPVVPTVAHRRIGLADVLQAVIEATSRRDALQPLRPLPQEFYEACEKIGQTLAEQNGELPQYLLERLVLDVGGEVEKRLIGRYGERLRLSLDEVRRSLAEAGIRVPFVEPKARYAWARRVLEGVLSAPPTRRETVSDRIDRVLTHRFAGLVIFALLMLLVFQAIYSWSAPIMDWLEAAQEWVGQWIAEQMSPGPLRSLLIDGVVAGVGSVLVFLPQIALLFFFIAVLEECGYMARAAFLMDKLMTRVGLSGKSFVPLMSSFACAVPGVMATRVIENYRDRMVTILVAPLMSCSARLPVYLLFIGAFIPERHYLGGWLSLRGLVLFAMMSVGAIVAIPVAWILRKTLFRGGMPPFVMELPTYRWPSARTVFYRVYDRCQAFVVRAGTVIFAATVLIWAAGYFPADHSQLDRVTAELQALQKLSAPPEQKLAALRRQRALLAREAIEQSYLGRAGRAIEPAVRLLGWDWRIGVGVLASFPAREIIIATLSTLYNLGGEVDSGTQTLQHAIRNARWPDGRLIFSVPVAVSIMVFFALCCQCVATLATIRRETNSWYWPAFTFAYMTTLAFLGAWLVYQVGSRLG